MKRLLDLIRVDFLTMNGGKNSMRMLAVLLILFCGGGGFFISPLVGVYCPFFMGGFFVSVLFQNEIKYHSEKLHSLLPIERKDLVNARFLFTTGLYIALNLLFYLLMLLSMKLKLYYLMGGEEADVLKRMAELSGNAFTELGFFNLLYFAAFAFGLTLMTSSLRKYFKDSEAFNMSLTFGKKRKADKKEIAIVLLAFGCILLWILIVSGVIPMGPVVMLVLQPFVQLAQAANGVLLGAVLVTMAVFSGIYKYVCTLIEYNEKEL